MPNKEWRSVDGHSSIIQAETTRAVLIKLPKEEWFFWHPAKLVRTSGKNDYRLNVSFTEEFEFKLFKNGKGKHNKFTKIAEKTISAREFELYWGEMPHDKKIDAPVTLQNEKVEVDYDLVD